MEIGIRCPYLNWLKHFCLWMFQQVRFASFLSDGFIATIVVNPPERKLAKRTSVCSVLWTWACRNCWRSRGRLQLGKRLQRWERLIFKVLLRFFDWVCWTWSQCLVAKYFVPVQIFCVGPKSYLHIVPVTNILCQIKRWFAFSEIGFRANTKVFEEALNAVKFLGWLKKFGSAQNILGPVKGQCI